MASMHNPAHPGAILREDVLPALGVSVTQAAEALDVTRVALSRVLNEHAAISSEMALRLEKWLGPENGGDAKTWLAMQSQYDLWHASKAAAQKLRRVKRANFEEVRGKIGEHAHRTAALAR